MDAVRIVPVTDEAVGSAVLLSIDHWSGIADAEGHKC